MLNACTNNNHMNNKIYNELVTFHQWTNICAVQHSPTNTNATTKKEQLNQIKTLIFSPTGLVMQKKNSHGNKISTHTYAHLTAMPITVMRGSGSWCHLKVKIVAVANMFFFTLAARTHTRQVCRIAEPSGCATPYDWSIVAKETALPCFPSGRLGFVTNLWHFPNKKVNNLEIFVIFSNPGTFNIWLTINRRIQT